MTVTFELWKTPGVAEVKIIFILVLTRYSLCWHLDCAKVVSKTTGTLARVSISGQTSQEITVFFTTLPLAITKEKKG